MLRNLLLSLLCFLTINSKAQCLAGVDVGLSFPVTVGYVPEIAATARPYLSGFVLSDHKAKVNFGIALSFEQYSLGILYHSGGNGSGTTITDNYSGSYLYASPIMDIGMGKQAKWHLSLCPSVGFSIGGSDKGTYYSKEYNGYNNYTLVIVDSAFSNNSGLSKVIVRFGIQLQRQFRFSGNNCVNLSLKYNYLFGTLTSAIDNLNISPASFSFGVGYMRELQEKTTTQAIV